MVHEARLTCANCGEAIVAEFVMVQRLKRSHAPAGCPYCGDAESVTRAMNQAVDAAGRRQPLLLEVRRDAKA